MNKPHPLASILPAMSTEDRARLKQDLSTNGLVDPIITFEGMTLEGVHREQLCKELGIKPVYEKFTGDDPAAFVFSKNIARRHLTTGQAAMCAADLLDRQGKRPGGQPRNDSGNSPSHLSVPDAAKAVGVDPTTVSAARRVKRERPDLAKRVKAGKASLNAAVEEMTGRQTGGNAPRRTKNWNGKTNPTRERELKANGKPGNYGELLRLSLQMNRVCTVIEAYKPEEFELDTETLVLIDSFYDDLVTLGVWVDRATMATQGWLDEVKVRGIIAALRDTTGRQPEEIPAYLARADKLERQLELQLTK